MKILIECTECGASQVAHVEPTEVKSVGVEHEDACAFLRAVEEDRADAWIKRNGYPIRYRNPEDSK